jgi:predicted dehydrogenase
MELKMAKDRFLSLPSIDSGRTPSTAVRVLLFFLFSLVLNFAADLAAADATSSAPLPVAIVGLVHGHVRGLFGRLKAHPEIKLVGISDPDPALREKYAQLFQLPSDIFYSSESDMLAQTHPQAILVYTSVAGHRAAIELAAPLHIAAMVEKPLCTTLEDAFAIQELSRKCQVPVLTNYETTWYPSNHAAADLLATGRLGELRKIVVHDGHSGPRELGVQPEFLKWLTDPRENGAGALFDFGCYGADLVTLLVHGELPLSVTAVTQQIKPQIYPNVDDESTIILTYPHAEAIIQASWNWPFNRKDMEVYGATGYVDADDADHLRVRLAGEKHEHSELAPPLAAPQGDPLDYLVAVLRHGLDPDHDLTSLDTNVTVMRILDAARKSARTHQSVQLTPSP